jgi:hypothetical protein
MFDKLKSGLKNLVSKVTTTELKPENLSPILSDFKMSLAENDVAYPVADKICDELEKRLTGVQVKRLEDRKKIVEDNLKQVLLDVMQTKNAIDLLKLIDNKRKKTEPFSLLFVLTEQEKPPPSLKLPSFCVTRAFLWFWLVQTLIVLALLNSWRSMDDVWVCV